MKEKTSPDYKEDVSKDTPIQVKRVDGDAELSPFKPPMRSATPHVEMDQPHVRPTKIDYIPESPVYEEEPIRSEELPANEDIYASNDGTSVIIEILDWVKYILIAVIIGLLLSYFVVQRSAVVGSSMSPTLLNQDQLLVEKVSIHFNIPEAGSIITVDSRFIPNYGHEEMLVKRVVAGPGDTVDFIDGKLYINDSVAQETYLPENTDTLAPMDWNGPLVIPENHVYVLGDNRAFSADSRVFGPVPEDAIVGHVLVRIYPFSRFGRP